MTLVDTSVWVDHLRRGTRALSKMLEAGAVLCHPFVIGELACGVIKNRDEILSLLDTLPRATSATHAEALHLVEQNGLFGSGIGWIDVHLIVSALLTPAPLWTLDKRLAAVADSLGLARTGDYR